MRLSRISLFFIVAGILSAPAPATADEPGKWAFNPPPDAFSPDALLDLRSLNERVAGQSGFVSRTPDGNDFAFGDGKPARFWAVTDYIGKQKDMGVAERHARFLAKRGVNMVRFHGALQPVAPDSKVTDVNEDEVDQCWRLVAAMKKAGIYTTVSPYWAVPVKLQPGWNIPGGTDQSACALIFWDKSLQQGYKAWCRALFARPNTYTGVPLAKDPAVAIIQLQNEDSMLFWTMQGVKGEQRKEIEARYADWLIKKYGSLEAAKAVWTGEGHPDDDFARGAAGMYINWEWTRPQSGGKAKRLADQLQFFGETMYRFNKEMADYLHNELGCRQLVNAGNWRTADPVKLDDVERWSYTACDVISVNRYFAGVHQGPRNGYALDNGDTFTNATCLLDPRALPVNYKQVVGRPCMVSESQWVFPTAYQSEGPLLVAAYASLTGVDTFYWFETGESEWEQWGHWASIWGINTPEQLGQFPAAALMYRSAYARKGNTAVHEERSLNDLWVRREPIIAEDPGFDPNRDKGDIAEKSSIKSGVDPLAFLVGPVEVKYGGDPSRSAAIDLTPFINHDARTVASDTGQLKLDYDTGLFTLNAPKAQCVCGFLKKGGGDFKLADVEIKSGNDYATVCVVSMDDRPLAASRKVLVQIGTVARPTGWKDRNLTFQSGDGKATYDGKQVVEAGGAPWQVEDTDVTITVKSPALRTATLLDANGVPVKKLDARLANGSLIVRLPPVAMYVVLQ